MAKQGIPELPKASMIRAEIKRMDRKKRYRGALRTTILLMIVMIVIVVFVSTELMPVYKVYGSAMEPTLDEGDIVIALKNADYQRGDIIALWFNNKILVKRIIALPGETVNIDARGQVYIGRDRLKETYIEKTEVGEIDISLPYQVPEGRYFVMGDNRLVSQDSRNAVIGCAAEEQIAGKVLFRIWPYEKIGRLTEEENTQSAGTGVIGLLNQIT